MRLADDRAVTTVPAFVQSLHDFGDRPALIESEATWSYRQLATTVESVASSLRESGPVHVIPAHNTIDCVVQYLSVLCAGKVAVMAAPCRADLLARTYPQDSAVHPELAVLLPTSGSTGDPKTVRLSRMNLDANAAAIATALGLRESDRAVTTLSPAYSYGLSVINSHLSVGASLVLTEGSVTDPDFFEPCGGVTVMPGVPYTFEMLRRLGFHAPDHLPHLRLLTCAGGRLPEVRVRELAAAGERHGFGLVVMYGQTEATARMAVLPADMAAEHPRSVGYPVPGGRFEIVGADGDGVGEIVFEGPSVMMGYARGPEDLTAEPMEPRLVTGDLGFIDDGLLHVTGRTTRFAKVRGLRMNLDDIEGCLEPSAAVCVELPERIGVVCDLDSDVVVTRVGARTGLPPAAVRVIRAEPPRLDSGKLDRAAALALLQQDDPPVEVGSKQRRLCVAYSRLLGRDAAPHDSFRRLGGDSMSFVAVSLEVERILGDLPVDWHLRSISELAGTADGSGPLRRMETSVVLRAAAIVLVVASHAAVIDVRGGAHLLVGLLGYNFARFQADQAVGRMFTSVAWLLVPALVWVGLAVLLSDQYSVSSLGWSWITQTATDSPDWRYWFVGALLWVLPVAMLLSAVPAVRRARLRWPLGVPAAATALALGVALLAVPDARPSSLFSPWAVLWVFFLGWWIARVRTGGQRVGLTITIACLSAVMFEDSRMWVIGLGLLVLVWFPRLRVPALLTGFVAVVAHASLFIYLSHWQVLELSRNWSALGLSLLLGVVLSIGWSWLRAKAARMQLGLTWDRAQLRVPVPRLRPDVHEEPAHVRVGGTGQLSAGT